MSPASDADHAKVDAERNRKANVRNERGRTVTLCSVLGTRGAQDEVKRH